MMLLYLHTGEKVFVLRNFTAKLFKIACKSFSLSLSKFVIIQINLHCSWEFFNHKITPQPTIFHGQTFWCVGSITVSPYSRSSHFKLNHKFIAILFIVVASGCIQMRTVIKWANKPYQSRGKNEKWEQNPPKQSHFVLNSTCVALHTDDDFLSANTQQWKINQVICGNYLHARP